MLRKFSFRTQQYKILFCHTYFTYFFNVQPKNILNKNLQFRILFAKYDISKFVSYKSIVIIAQIFEREQRNKHLLYI